MPLFIERPAVAAPGFHIGTSSWTNLAWGHGVLPADVPAGSRLAYLARHLNSVEINSTFYRVPTPHMVARWVDAVGPDFRFSVKVNREITHERRLRDCRKPLDEFAGAVSGVGRKAGAMLIQLPPSFRPGWRDLERFLHVFHTIPDAAMWRPVVELRNRAWPVEETKNMLDENHCALCVSDAATYPTSAPNSRGPVYVRRHGTVGMYRGGYSPGQLAADAAALRPFVNAGRDVYVYFNNTIDHHAYANALALRDLTSAVHT